jgi:hypothetical protein
LDVLDRRYLQIPATSASSERYFSQGNLNITKLRNRLNKSTFNMIMCLKSWGIVNEDIEGEDKKKAKDYSIKDQEEAYFVL